MCFERLCLYQPDFWTDYIADLLAELYDSEITRVLDTLILARKLTNRHFRQAKIDAKKSSLRQLWHSIDALLGCGCVPPLDAISADCFHCYFDDKVASVRSATAGAPPPLFRPMSCIASFQDFKPVCVDDVVAAVRVLIDKSCASDPLLTTWLKVVVDVVAPFLTHLLNCSLSSSIVPHSTGFQSCLGYMSLLIKKSDMDLTDFCSYRPISDLLVVSKVLERLVDCQLLAY